MDESYRHNVPAGSESHFKVVLVSDRPNKGAIYMTYQWWIGACNELVTENLSPITKTPEYKYCAVRVTVC